MDKITEFCPHCEQEVELNEEFKVQQCPNCGKHIVPCNMCPLLAENKCPNKCPLATMAEDMNKVPSTEKKSFVTDLYALETSAISEIIDMMVNNQLQEVKIDGVNAYKFVNDDKFAIALTITKVTLHKSESLIKLTDEWGNVHFVEEFHLGTMQFIYKAVYEKIYE